MKRLLKRFFMRDDANEAKPVTLADEQPFNPVEGVRVSAQGEQTRMTDSVERTPYNTTVMLDYAPGRRETVSAALAAKFTDLKLVADRATSRIIEPTIRQLFDQAQEVQELAAHIRGVEGHAYLVDGLPGENEEEAQARFFDSFGGYTIAQLREAVDALLLDEVKAQGRTPKAAQPGAYSGAQVEGKAANPAAPTKSAAKGRNEFMKQGEINTIAGAMAEYLQEKVPGQYTEQDLQPYAIGTVNACRRVIKTAISNTSAPGYIKENVVETVAAHFEAAGTPLKRSLLAGFATHYNETAQKLSKLGNGFAALGVGLH
ncbi:hypothetical protein JCM19240_3983 [Vibrio maritimus]|uniref:Uncharacterized protein n=1 Tax=Vibrio maritimus TaxID=990268 RepID=A0A090U610_9VIBR|nr:hypothetical protein JCM19240_3983 [Vibrio maritimus]